MSHSNIRQIATVLVLAGVGSPAFAEFRYENGSGGSATFYGQFSPAYLSFDDGESTTDEIVDNSNSNSRVGLWLRGVYGDNNLALNVETALGLRQSSALSATNTPKAIDWERTSIRKVDVSWETASFGTFYIGQGSMATDGVAENDLSGTSLVMYSSVPDTAGGFEFRDSSGAFSGITIGSRFSNLDGGRRGRVRYDTPEFSGFILSAAYGEEILDRDNDNKFADVALKYSADITDFKIQAAVGYSHTDRDGASNSNDTIGSLSVLHTSGFNATVAAGDRDNDGGSYVYGKLGYKYNWLSIGQTAVSVDYYSGNDFGNDGFDSSSWGIGAVQKFDDQNLEAYAAYREYELDAHQDASSVFLGARWKF